MGRITVVRGVRAEGEPSNSELVDAEHEDTEDTNDLRDAIVHKGDTLLDALLDSGIDVEHECGGSCACTTCLLDVVAGAECLSVMEEPERERIATLEEELPEARLACQALVMRENAEITVLLRASGDIS